MLCHDPGIPTVAVCLTPLPTMKEKLLAIIITGAVAALAAPAGAEQPKGAAASTQRARLAEEAWAARSAAGKIEAAVSSLERAVAAKATAIKTGQEKAASAQKAAEKAAAERSAAEKALEAAAADGKEKARKLLDQKTAAVKKAESELAAARKAVEKATAEKAEAEKKLATERKPMDEALDAAALAHARALGGLKPITSKDWDYAKARHLLFRAGFGAPPEEVEKLVKMGPHRAVAHLVEYRELPLANIDPEKELYSWEKPLAYEKLLPEAVQRKIAEEAGEQRNVLGHAVMIRWWVRRLLESPRQLEEKLVLFWHDHFASSYRALGETYLMYQQNNLFRRYADNYDALAHGIVEDPAMIRYLNNDENVMGQNNENLGRELLELFTLGEENCTAHRKDGYSEKDVRDGNTRSLTGATYEHYSGQHRFYVTKHDPSPKTLLGKAGAWGPHEAVDIMLEHPATARYLVKKLWQFFVNWEPDPAVADQLAVMLRENGYAIRPLLRNIFLSEEFYSAKSMGRHIKSPVELLVGTARTMQFPKVDYQDVRFLLAAMGQNLFDPPSVAGWAEGSDWVNTTLLMARYTAVTDLIKDTKPDLAAVLKDQKLNSAAEVVDHLARRCLLVELSSEKRQELIAFLGPLPPSSEWAAQQKEINARLVSLLVLLVTSPEYQVS